MDPQNTAFRVRRLWSSRFRQYRPRTQKGKLVQLQRLNIHTPLDLLLRHYEDRSGVIDIRDAVAGDGGRPSSASSRRW